MLTRGTAATLAYSSQSQAENTRRALERSGALVVTGKHSRVVQETPPLPYTTLAMIEDAAQTMGWGGRKTMAEAQTLFEQGLITYPRSDSTRMAPEAIQAIRDVIVAIYGADALPDSRALTWNALAARLRPGTAGAQDAHAEADVLAAHEAIRPTDPAVRPDQLPDREMRALYRLIWQRSLASQMRPARYKIIEVEFRVAP